MKNKIFAALAAMMMLTAGTATAQYNEANNLFYHSFRTPQSNTLNPALFPNRNSFYLSLPGLDFRFHSPLALSDFVYYDSVQKFTVISIDSLFDGLATESHFRISPSFELAGLGIKIRNTHITAKVRLVNDLSLGVPTSAINALRSGNLDADGNPITELSILDGDIFSLQSYLEAGVGIGHYFAPIHLGLGVRAKLLYGLLNARTTNTRVVLNTDQDLNSISADIYYEAQLASAVPFDITDTSFSPIIPTDFSSMLNLDNINKGFAFDFGAYYDFGPLRISASIIDLSQGINWNHNTYKIVPRGGNATVPFTGINMNNLLGVGETGDTMDIAAYISELTEKLPPTLTEDTADYWYSIPTKINVGASFSFLKMFRAGLLFHGQFDRGLISHDQAMPVNLRDGLNTANEVFNNIDVADFRWNTTVSFGVNFFNWMELIAGTSIVYDGTNYNWFNPGAGAVFTPLSMFQMYIMADYMSNIYVVDCKHFNVKFGFNLLIGNGGKKHHRNI